MKFKVDENLPLEVAGLLQTAGYDAYTVNQESLGGMDDPHISQICLREDRILVTLDLDFADVRTYPHGTFRALSCYGSTNRINTESLLSCKGSFPYWC